MMRQLNVVRGLAVAAVSTTALMCAALIGPSASAQQETIVCEGSTTVLPIAEAFAEHFMRNNPNVNVTVAGGGSGNGAKAIANSTAHVGDMSRFMKESEFQACVANGVTPVAHVVALDGLAIVVNPRNSVSALTVEQVRGIYAGQITNWSQVGGPNMPVVLIGRDHNSGTFETFKKLVMAKLAEIHGSCQSLGSNGAVRQAVVNTPGAIGYVGLGFLDGVKPLTISGVDPSPRTVKSGEYPIARPLFMFTNGYPKMGSALYRFINTYLSEEGQEIIESIGFVPVTDY